MLPSAAARATLVLEGLDTGTAVKAMAAAMGSPFEVTGAVHDVGAGRTMLRIEGFETQVAYRAETDRVTARSLRRGPRRARPPTR